MKSYIKYIVVSVIALAIVITVLVTNKKDENIGSAPTTEATTKDPKITANHGENSTLDIETQNVERESVYHENEGIDELIAKYNKIAKVKIEPDMVSKGSYSVNANIIVNDISIIIYNTDSAISVDYSYEGKSDKAIYPIFRDFSKVLKPKLTDKKIKQAWTEIKEGKYVNSSFYSMKGIEVTYIKGEVDDKVSHYLIRTKKNKKSKEK